MPEHAVTNWRHDAKCGSAEDPELWFPVGTSRQENARAADATAICVTCPVRLECAKFAVNTGRTSGVWAGFRLDDSSRAVDERKQLRKYIKDASGAATAVCEDCGDTYTLTGGSSATRCTPCRLDLIDSGPAREHLIALSRSFDLKVIAPLVKANRHTIGLIVRGQKPLIKADLSARILALRAGETVHA